MGSKRGFIRAAAVSAALAALFLAGCGKGDGGASESKKPEKASEAGSETAAVDMLQDSRDGQKYRIVKIGDKTWMAENLKHKTSVRECYDNDDSNCDKYGELYSWARAMTACPAGWHLPTRDDWDDLAQTAGGEKRQSDNSDSDWRGVSNKLKAKSGWENDGGTDEYGFAALPGGGRIPDIDSDFGGLGACGYWWMAAERDGDTAYRWGICQNETVTERGNSKALGFSVRCVKD